MTVDYQGYTPDQVHVAVGSTVTWSKAIHCDADTTITSESAGFAGGLVTSDEPYVFYFATPGAYFYHMDGYERFKGVVIVG